MIPSRVLRMQIRSDMSKLNFINGERCVPMQPTHSTPVIEPRSGKKLCDMPCSGPVDVNTAIDTATAALKPWSRLSCFDRGSVLIKCSDLIRDNLEDIARLESTGNGKPLYESRMDIEACADTFKFYGGIAPTIMGDHIPLSDGNFAFTRREPLGVVVGVGAWNYPFQTMTWKCAPALACGNTFIYKPSPFTPETAIILAEILTKAGAPKGVVSVLQGEGKTGHALSSHAGVAKVSFTGSVATGQKIMRACTENGIRQVTLELGGKSPLIIFEDADMDNAVSGALMANYLTQGEVCSNASRVFVHKSIVDKFTAKVAERTKAMKIGDPLVEGTKIGATIHKDHAEKVLSYIKSARDEGATVVHGGEKITLDDPDLQGEYLSPCIITNATDDMKICRDEIFGAAMIILPFESEDEVVSRANDTTLGLAAGVFTNNLQRAHRVVANLQAGTVYVNNYNIQPVEVPFGGYKSSGFGRENGIAAIHNYSQIKSVYMEMNNVDAPF